MGIDAPDVTAVYLPLFLPLYGQHALPALLAAPAQATLGVYPLEALGQYVADVGQVQQKQWHAHDGVKYGGQLAEQRPRSDVTVTWQHDNKIINNTFRIAKT